MKCGPISHVLYCTDKLGPFAVTRRIGLVSHVLVDLVRTQGGRSKPNAVSQGDDRVFSLCPESVSSD